MKRIILMGAIFLASYASAQTWRACTDAELKQLVPARATVEKERIETEFRTATGITNGKGKAIAGVLMITAGYSAEGKYSHWLLVESPIKIGGVALRAGEYVFGHRRNQDVLEVTFYEAASGKEVGVAQAKLERARGRISSLRIVPPSERQVIELGRFVVPYQLTQ